MTNEDIHNDAGRGMLANEDVSQEQKEEMAAATRERRRTNWHPG